MEWACEVAEGYHGYVGKRSSTGSRRPASKWTDVDEGRAEFERGPFGRGPRVFAKVCRFLLLMLKAVLSYRRGIASVYTEYFLPSHDTSISGGSGYTGPDFAHRTVSGPK